MDKGPRRVDAEKEQQDVPQNEEGGEKQDQGDRPFAREPEREYAAASENDERADVVKEKDRERKKDGGIGAERSRKIETEKREDRARAAAERTVDPEKVVQGTGHDEKTLRSQS